MMKKSKRIALVLLVSVICAALLWGCAAPKGVLPGDGGITKISDLAGKKIAATKSSSISVTLDGILDNVQQVHLEDIASQLEAVKAGKADAAITAEPIARLAVARHPELMILGEKLTDDGYGFAFRKGDPMAQEVSRVIAKLREDGTLKELGDKWFGGDESAKVLPKLTYKKDFDGSAGVLRFGHNVNTAPMSYLGSDGKAAGHDIELAMRIAYELNMTIETTNMDNESLLLSLDAGKSDMVGGCISITEERKKTVDFSDAYYAGGTVAIIPKSPEMPTQSVGFKTLEELRGEKIGVLTGSIFASFLEVYVPGAVPVYFNNSVDQAEALRTGRIEAIVFEESTAQDMINSVKGLRMLDETMGVIDYAFIYAKENTELAGKVDAVLLEMKSSGELETLWKKWSNGTEDEKVIADIPLSGENGVLRVAANSISPPNVYIKNGKPTGFEVEAVTLVAQRLGMGLEIMDMDFAAIIPAVTTGKCAVGIGQISVTEERRKNILFSAQPTGSSPLRLVVREEAPTVIAALPWYQSFGESFKNTFITEERYKLILQGLGTTMIISLFSLLFGTVMGFGVCMMRRSERFWLNSPAKLFIRVMHGVPIVVILMILFFLVFTDPNANPIVVAVIGFSINFAAYSSEMMRTGIDAVDKGQLEAASAIGFNKVRVFWKITLPQAARHVLPVFKGEFISMVKMTSVVGYIAIQDLTRMSDIIRSRTYEAFFPLIATAVIYFVISDVLASLLTLVEVRIDPHHRERVIKGVITTPQL